ncbi:MAG: radical SAM protein [Thermodesulfobacteriota bacterium]
MNEKNCRYIFGPVPSRRLGQSLGINNIPPKVCTYSCVYCQLGRTAKLQIERNAFYEPEEILKEVKDKIKKTRKIGEYIDYLTFVPDGEPTLDINLGKEIELLKSLGIKIAVITNSSLLYNKDLWENLSKANLVSLKIDSVREHVWRKINRPHKRLNLDLILDGILGFASYYRGKLITETMFVKGLNDGIEQIYEIVDFLSLLRPFKAYLSIPTRPPAEKWVQPPEEEKISSIFQIFKKRIEQVEYLIGYEGNAFAFTGDIEEDLMSITSVHPMREDAVKEFLSKAKVDRTIIQKLVANKELIVMEYKGKRFYMRRFQRS